MNKDRQSDLRFCLQQIALCPSEPPIQSISQYVQGRRIMPPNSPFPGLWDNEKTPYAKEWMDNMAPNSPIQHQVIMKGAQVSGTEAMLNTLAYYMDQCPAQILYITAKEELLEKWSLRRLEPLIDSMGIRHKVLASKERLGVVTRRAVDKTLSKEFIGGCLDLVSARSAASLRAESKRILLRDEVDGAPALLTTGEGFWLDVSYARTKAYGSLRKVMDVSTPSTFEDSQIFQLYERGDRRKYFVPCPSCGHYQELVWEQVTPEYKSGKLFDVSYKCIKCSALLKNHQKREMLSKGEWRPTAVSDSKVFRSYHLSTLYAPVGMSSWFEMYEEFTRAQEQPDGMRGFTNLSLGMPYKEKGVRPILTTLQNLRSTYKSGEVPDGVLFLTMAVDVQAGQERNDGKPARLVVEVCGHGKGFRTWSITYRDFVGPIDDISSGAWMSMTKWFQEIQGSFYRSDGQKFPISLVLIDSGYDAHIVYDFCRNWQHTLPSKGYSLLKKNKKEKGLDEAGPDYFRRYRLAKVGDSKEQMLAEISTNYYKHHIYTNLSKVRNEDKKIQAPGFCEFPRDYSDDYFRELSAEERRADHSFYLPSKRANEALDCRVYNMAAADIFLDKLVNAQQAEAKNAGLLDIQIRMINHARILEILEKRTQRSIITIK